jgi:murein L,D-transpeptidase YcbB/YkuD
MMNLNIRRGRRLVARLLPLPLLLGLAASVSSAVQVTRPPETGPTPDPAVAATVEHVLGSGHHPRLKWPDIPRLAPALKAAYESEPDRLIWFEGTEPSATVTRALGALGAAGEHGLDPADYDAEWLSEEWSLLQPAADASGPDRALFDIGLSVAVVRLLAAVHLGRVDPATLHWGYDVSPKVLDLRAALREVRNGKGVDAALAELEPPYAHYLRARRALAAYKELARDEPEPVPPLPPGRTKVEEGDAWDGVEALAARLRALGDLAPGETLAGHDDDGRPLYAGPLVAAVERFQTRHGLDQDGIIGKATLAALNVPAASRVRQIELALERMRWLPDLATRPTVFVNVPLFRLWASDPDLDEEPLRMNVVVGKSLHHHTPLFVEQMEYVVFRPYWNVPYSIAARESVPRTRKDPSYLDTHDMEIVASGGPGATALPATNENLDQVVAGTLRIRQRPGPKNALGLAKFIFPNADNVYMHGTPAQQLFSRARRDFSHGCIRLERPARLGEWVLRDQTEWTRERIEAAMQGSSPTRVNLTEPLMVVLFYDTVHVNSEGEVFFVEDIYGHDEALDAALGHGYPYPRNSGGGR